MYPVNAHNSLCHFTRASDRTTDCYHPSSDLGVDISEGCFIFDFAPLPLEVDRPYHVRKSGHKTSIII